MPKVATIDGIRIFFFFDEHPPPHFHAEYAEYQAMIDIETLRVIEGDLPRPQHRKVVTWAKTRKPQLLDAWISCRSDLTPGKIV
jgi:Domain of unknown function (DUF4160)